MRQGIIILGFAVTFVLTSLIVMTIDSDISRKDELKNAVAAAVKQSVKKAIDNPDDIDSNKKLVAQFTNNLIMSLNSKGNIDVEVMGVDYKKGMLDVLVTLKYKYINGRDGSISVRKCAIYE